MKKLHFVTGYLQSSDQKPFTVSAVAGSKEVRTWEFETEDESCEFLKQFGSALVGSVAFADVATHCDGN
jgi:hypothetical protein